MSNVLIFAGSSCPALTSSICSRLSTSPAPVELSQFANGETSVKILTSIREKDVFVVQSGSSRINDSIMELLILISACKGGSANKITAVLPYFPYSRQSKKKSHRGSITARMLANLLSIAGVHHVITIDLHASQMQGFFKCPVDNLHAEPLIATWIRHNVPNWHEAVCVSKNAGGTKRVTSLADALKLNFGMITTDKKRGGTRKIPNETTTTKNDNSSMTRPKTIAKNTASGQLLNQTIDSTDSLSSQSQNSCFVNNFGFKEDTNVLSKNTRSETKTYNTSNSQLETAINKKTELLQEPSDVIPQEKRHIASPPNSLLRSMSLPAIPVPAEEELEFIDERARDIIQGRLVHGHIVPDDYPSPPSISRLTKLKSLESDSDETTQIGNFEENKQPLLKPEEVDVTSDEEEENFKSNQFERMITLVGDVRNRTVFIVDDMIDKAGSWIAAAECVVKRGGAKKVYCIATHGLFGGDSLEELQDCDCIDTIVVTNSFPISSKKVKAANKLIMLDLSHLLSEAIRRNHYGESLCPLFTHSYD
ncbi:Ribose-phosphate pyrophosphokinase 1 [Erysiphe necator]|uniref:Ribose-phosphate pyrophosphokinase 1 n=1 Tax=Uncinula necator TaxID=52586 RepID=A0A0B1NX90_UNCNE|nr:Ribose-phosphate pyrophosphokinase 1 [Erysiphe necator]KHJ30598.1 putative ribose-phosphate pyrophosphokinase [Erysiphe necator]